jgi:pimeloyl-ACP methyl ester carboxylesterase
MKGGIVEYPRTQRIQLVVGNWRRIGMECLLALFGAALSVFATLQAAEIPLTPGDSLALSATAGSETCERYRARSWLRQRVVRSSDLERYGLQLDDGWQQAPADQPVVVLLHGFNSDRQQNSELIRPLLKKRIACGTFAYPNDHTITESAGLLSQELRRFAARHPDRNIALVCHSMGGLVARACLENALLDPGNVRRLVMIAPPTHGTLIAHFAVGTDVYEHWLSRSSGGPWRRMRDSVIDGLGEAADELRPESEFLRGLNAQPRNPRIRYTVLLGTAARFDDEQIAWIRDSFCESLAKVPGADGSAERLAAILDDIDEVIEGKGDGIVAVKRGRLDGVADTIVMPFGHMAVTGEPRNETLRQVQQVVLQRVQ